MKILKFGGKSLAEREGRKNALQIIKYEKQQGEVAVVVSAIGDTTDRLQSWIDEAVNLEGWKKAWMDFTEIYKDYLHLPEVQDLLKELESKGKQTALDSNKDQLANEVLAYGERLSSELIAHELQNLGLKALPIDARKLIKVRDGAVLERQSRENTELYFEHFNFDQIPVITGYIASDEQGRTQTLGRNGSNYSASLLSNFLQAEEFQNWTNVDGVFTAKPDLVDDARVIEKMTYQEAHEMANFGTNVLHPKTLSPLLETNIRLSIRNTFKPDFPGTQVDSKGGRKGIKSISVLENVAMISIEGSGLLDNIGIDARIFAALSKANISIRLIAQASSERGIGFVVDKDQGKQAQKALQAEFWPEWEKGWIRSIALNTEIAIIAILGRHNYSLEKAISGLRRNRIWMHLISNSISGFHISLVVDSKHLQKAVNVVHSQVFGALKTIHVFGLGKGVVGGTLIDQLLATSPQLIEQRRLQIKVIGVADSRRILYRPEGITSDWRRELANSREVNNLEDLLKTLKQSGLENLVIADNTSSQEISNRYPDILRAGIDLVASNKKHNSGSLEVYQRVRQLVERKGRKFYYETNVGAGLPIIDTLKHLRDSADVLTEIKGVYSGSLSYLFNTFSEGKKSFTDVLLEARELGYTEPDPREDLSGLDVARKLVILAREAGVDVSLEDVKVEGLIPESLRELDSFEDLLKYRNELDEDYLNRLKSIAQDHVLRYVGEANCRTGELKVSLVQVPRSTALGQMKGADSLFEIYTEAYGQNPMIIQGAGAGGEVTARGVYSDLIRIGS
ncbi:bifunctional aspartate kinase/homoserine dehydrogenase I [bacterium SCSIO 12741]|nr:bifunctional aspartate kinase/homoserine dehydrogenase I [bacterium SCSIO 12741]